MELQSTVLSLNCFTQIGEDIKKGLGVAPEDSDLKKSQDRLQKLLMLVNAWLHICSILQSSSSSSSSSSVVLVLAH